MKALIIGAGGKEHALVWKLARSKHVARIYCSPGNAGIAEIAECIDVSPHNVDALVDFVKYEWIDLTIVCSEIPIAENIVDAFDHHGCRLFGLHRGVLMPAAGRVASKHFMKRHRIPTAEFRVFSSYLLAQDYVRMKGFPLVVKTDGYPGEKGVFPAATIEEAENMLRRIMKENICGDSGNRVIIEEHLKGERVSVLTIADDRTIIPLAYVYKYKGMTGLNAHSGPAVLASYSPARVTPLEIEKDIMEKAMRPLHNALHAEGAPFRGFISADLVIGKDNIYLAELRFGFGDMEPQTIAPGLKADIGELILSASEGRLSDVKIKAEGKESVCIALFTGERPAAGSAGLLIEGIDAAKQTEDVVVFHENTLFDNHNVVTPGGTALFISATGADRKEAAERAYSAAEKIHSAGMRYGEIPRTM